MKRLTAAAATIALLGLAALPGSAGATGPPTTPNGYVGAMNMLQDPTMAPGTGGGDGSRQPQWQRRHVPCHLRVGRSVLLRATNRNRGYKR